MQRSGRALLAAVGVLLLAVLAAALAGAAGCMSGTPPAADGRTAAGRLAPCPSRPNCVCSEGVTGVVAGGGGGHAAGEAGPTDATHAIEPLAFAGPPEKAWAALQAVLAETPRVAVVHAAPGYLHAEFTSRLFRFVDEVEFRHEPGAGVIHVRSASRLGYSDLGANRRRVEALRVALSAKLSLGAAAVR